MLIYANFIGRRCNNVNGIKGCTIINDGCLYINIYINEIDIRKTEVDS